MISDHCSIVTAQITQVRQIDVIMHLRLRLQASRRQIDVKKGD